MTGTLPLPHPSAVEQELIDIKAALDKNKVPTEIDDHVLGGKRQLTTAQRVQLVAYAYEISQRPKPSYQDR